MPRDKIRPPAGNRRAEGDGINVNSMIPPTADILAVRAEGCREKKRRTQRLEGVTS